MAARRCIAVAAHKGGSGKTTLAVNLAGALGASGCSVAVVDGDPQGAATIGLGIVPGSLSLYEVLIGAVDVRAAIMATAAPGVSVLPATLDLAGAEVELPRRPGWQTVLAERLRPLGELFDVTIVDTPPGLGVLSYMALSAADQVLVACPPDFLAVRSLPMVLQSVERAGVELIGIVPTMVERRTRHEADFSAYLEQSYGDRLLGAIPRRVILRDALAAGLPITSYSPRSDAAEAFHRLAKGVLNAKTTT
jgi:chromosome partitioning protein